MVKKKVLALFLGLLVSFSSNSYAKTMSVHVISDTANKSHWTQELAKFADQINKLQTQIENQMDMINKKALDLMSFGEGDLAGAGKDISSMFNSINSIHDSINAIATDYQKTVSQWNDLMPDDQAWKDKSLLNMANQTAKTRDAWEKALEQGLLVTASHDAGERTKTQKALDDALRLSKNAKGSVQSLQALAQLNGINASALQQLGNQLTEANRMRAISDMHKINEQKKAENYTRQEVESYGREVDSLKNIGDRYKSYSGKSISRK